MYLNLYLPNMTIGIINNFCLHSTEKLTITVSWYQEQIGDKDYGLFMALVFNLNTSKLKFHLEAMRAHLVFY